MPLILLIDLIAVIGLFKIARSSGVEAALPFATFMIVLVPIESSISLGLFELTTQRLIIAVLVVLYLCWGRHETWPREGLPLPLKVLILIHVSWCALSTVNSVVPLMSVKKAISVIVEYYALYFIYWRMLSKTETIQKILFAIVCALVICSAFGAFEAYGADNVLSYFPRAGHHFDMNAETDREIRVQSTYDHPILFGAALAMGITIALYLISITRRSWKLVFLWVGLMLMFLNIYKTSSRGPWLDVILALLLFLVLSRGGLRKYVLIIGLLSVAAMVIRPGIWATVKGIYDNSFDMNTSTGTSYQYRYALQNAVRSKLLQSPGRAMWGYGLESFYDLQLEADFLGKPHLFLSCDSSWSELMIETGFVGLAIIIMVLVKPLWHAFGDYRRLPRMEKDVSLLLGVNLIVFYFQMYSVGMYSWGQNGYTLWILIAMTFAYSRCRRVDTGSHEIEVEQCPADVESLCQTI